MQVHQSCGNTRCWHASSTGLLCCAVQEAELVQLQGAATSARRRIKSATSATLQEMLERYSSAAAAWAGASAPGGSPTGSR